MFQAGDTVRLMDCWRADTSVPAREHVVADIKFEQEWWINVGTGWVEASIFELVKAKEMDVSKGEFGEPVKADTKWVQIGDGRDDISCRGWIETAFYKVEIHGDLDYEDRLKTAKRYADCVNALDGLNPEAVPELVKAARNMLDMYKRSHDSGDWGNWDLEDDQEYVALRSALAKIEQPPARQG